MAGNPRTRQKSATPGPLRAALAKRTNLRTYHDIAIADATEIEAAQRRLDAARQMHTATLLHDDQQVRERAEQLVKDAEAARDALFHRIWFRGLPQTEFDALVDLHPPTDEQAKNGNMWNAETFHFALIAETAENEDHTPGDLTAEEWKAEITGIDPATGEPDPDREAWTGAERRQVIYMALAAQRQTMADAVPKG